MTEPKTLPVPEVPDSLFRHIREAEARFIRETTGLDPALIGDASYVLSAGERASIAQQVAANLPDRDKAAVTAAEAKRERRRERNRRNWEPRPTSEQVTANILEGFERSPNMEP